MEEGFAKTSFGIHTVGINDRSFRFLRYDPHWDQSVNYARLPRDNKLVRNKITLKARNPTWKHVIIDLQTSKSL